MHELAGVVENLVQNSESAPLSARLRRKAWCLDTRGFILKKIQILALKTFQF